jgi:aldehyde:ferredoxin oxidoreductase
MSEASVQWGDAPVRNWAGSERDYPLRMSASIDPGRLQAQEEFRYHCVTCPLGCGSLLRREEELEHKPEYETVASLSALMLNTDLNAVFAANDLLNRAGMDTISAGGTIAWAMECRERGVLTQTDLDGIDLRWGNGPAIVALVRKMIAREGIGDLLANGSAEAARKVGGGSEAWTVQAGGQELALHDPRLDPGLALHAVVDPTPGRHTQGGWIYYDSYQLWRKLPELPRPPLFTTKSSRFLPSAENGQKAAAVSRYHQLINAAGVCMFGAYLGVHRFPLFEWLNAATGWDRSPAEYMEVGNRIQALRQRFNLQQGIDPRRVEIAPRAAGHPPQTVGANRGRSIPMAAMVRAYWQSIGWDAQTGEPPVLPDSESRPSFKQSVSPWLPVTPDSTWDRVPGSLGKSPRRLVKQPQIDLVRCVCCRLCVLTCPTHALDLLLAHPQRRHRPAGLVRETDCIGCGFCERVCPMEAIVMQRGKSESGESSV